MQRRIIRSKNTERILAGHEAGAYALPIDVLALKNAITRHENQPPLVAPASEDTVRLELVDQATRSTIDSKPLPPAAKTLALARAHSLAWQDETALRTEVGSALEWGLADTIAGLSETIIVTCLQPALAEVQAELADVVKILPADCTARDIVLASEEVRAAWGRLEALAVRYEHIRRAWASLGVPSKDADFDDSRGDFHELANLAEVWPRHPNRNMQGAQTPPWPTASNVARLLWLGHHGAVFIAPTLAERKALWKAANADMVKRQAVNAANAAQFRGAFGF